MYWLVGKYENPWVRQICQEQIWTDESSETGLEEVEYMDVRNNPLPPANINNKLNKHAPIKL